MNKLQLSYSGPRLAFDDLAVRGSTTDPFPRSAIQKGVNSPMNSQEDDPQILPSSFPFILLASDSPRTAEGLYRDLLREGFRVHFAPGYAQIEPLWQQHRHDVVLLEVSNPQSVETAVDIALRLKRRDARQFVGYLADPVLHTSGLAGDAIFPRSPHHLPQALRDHFSRES
jgi:hypothetical protein